MAQVSDGQPQSYTFGFLQMPDARHIARHHPKRVLAEVQAKRKILDDSGDRSDSSAHQLTRLLALPYRDHPDYLEEWTPSE